MSGRITAMEPLPADAVDLSCDIAEKELFRAPIEIDALELLPLALAEAEVDEDADVDDAGVELLLELLELLHAATSSAAAAAAAVSPALADTEYNGVPRSFSQTCRGHVRDQIPTPRPESARLFAEIVGLPGETFPLTLP